jgi:ComEC/Rec2-related protein
MQNYNVYGLMSLFQPRGGEAPIHLVHPAGGETRHGNFLVEFSLHLRDDVLRVIKQTVVFPHSAFIGGVTLGLRYGLQGVECMFSDRYRHVWQKEGEVHEPGCEETIADEFKEAGVNHVLAVSGLHVTIITVMFVGIFSMLRIPRQAYVPLIILALVIFSIITGARPSTLRAVIMNSLFMMTWAYMDQSLRSSVLLGVPVAAFLILLHNPLVLVDPSFTLSFGAILSLGLLTTPSLDLLQRLKGNQFVLFVIVAVGGTLIGIRHWALLVTPQFLLPVGALLAVLFMLAGRLQQHGWGISERINYGIIPEGPGAFFAAQFAIQIGMMIPLSVFYFCRWPFAGAYSNLIAIPLIGVVVQLGAIGGLLGMIPGVGLYLALLLGAANWLFSCVFLWLAHASSEWWPYPFIRRPGLLFVGTYYVLCAWLIWRRPIGLWIADLCQRRVGPQPWLPRVVKAVLFLAILVPLLGDLRADKPDGLRLQFLSVGYGSAVLVESPGGKRILVDAGFVEHERGRRNEAIRTVIPYLAYRSIRHLDGFIVSSARPERAAGASYVMEHLWVDHVFVPPTLANLVPGESFDTFAARFSDAEDVEPSILSMSYEELIGNAARPRRSALAPALAKRGPSWVNRWAGWDTRVQAVQAGQALFEEKGPGGVFRIEVLNPGAGASGERSYDDGSLVLRVVYGDFAVLLTGDLQHQAVGELAARYAPEALRAQVMVLPHRGTTSPPFVSEFKGSLQSALRTQLGALLDRVKPDRVLAEYGSARPVLGMVARDAQQAHDVTRRYIEDRLGAAAWLSTDRDLAITLSSDGHTYSVVTQAELNRAEGGEEDAVSDIAVGL